MAPLVSFSRLREANQQIGRGQPILTRAMQGPQHRNQHDDQHDDDIDSQAPQQNSFGAREFSPAKAGPLLGHHQLVCLKDRKGRFGMLQADRLAVRPSRFRVALFSGLRVESQFRQISFKFSATARVADHELLRPTHVASIAQMRPSSPSSRGNLPWRL